jgi:hypothetical protein
MRDFRDAKAMARALRGALAEQGHAISNSQSLELIAKAFGLNDWNTLSAKIQAAGKAEPAPEPPPRPKGDPARLGFSPTLQATLHGAVAAAARRQHEYATLEHLLLALTDDPDAAAALDACRVDRAALKATVERYLDTELKELVVPAAEPKPTPGFQRVIQRAVIHIQAAGGEVVTGANVLVGLFSEQESHAAFFLGEQGVTRLDVVNVLVHGLPRRGPPGVARA